MEWGQIDHSAEPQLEHAIKNGFMVDIGLLMKAIIFMSAKTAQRPRFRQKLMRSKKPARKYSAFL